MEAEIYMQRCLQLAKLGMGKVKTNPMVGCVVVKKNTIIGEGYHEKYGDSHAEVNALKKLTKEDLTDATVYVSLEPCSHFGKTPPCANLLIEKGVKNIHIAMKDPNPKVSGMGIKLLQDAGVNVSIGLLEKEAAALNKIFLHGIQHNLPYITLKWAESADGFIAGENGGDKISNEVSDIYSHNFRDAVDAILVGSNTIETDKPTLNARLFSEHEPLKLSFSSSAKEGYIHVNPKNAISDLKKLYGDKNIAQLLVEGGTETINYFIENGLYQSINIIKATNLYLEKGTKAPIIPNRKAILSEKKVILNNLFYKHTY